MSLPNRKEFIDGFLAAVGDPDLAAQQALEDEMEIVYHGDVVGGHLHNGCSSTGCCACNQANVVEQHVPAQDTLPWSTPYHMFLV